MLTIAKEQMTVFREPAIEAFVKKVIVHLNKCFPDKCQEMGEARVREMIKFGIQRSARYRINGQRDVCKYIDLMMVYGQDFDQDPKLPWAAEILSAEFLEGHSKEKADRLYNAAMENVVAGHSTQGAP